MLVVSDVEHVSHCVRVVRIARLNGSRSVHDALNDIVDIEAVTFLVAVTKHRDWLIQQCASHEDRKKSLEVVA